jgi:hypothetical protein
MENAEANEPIDPIESAEPTDPIERKEPLDPTDRNDASDQSDSASTGGIVPRLCETLLCTDHEPQRSGKEHS